MGSLKLLLEARAAGLTVTVQADRLVIRGPKSAAPLARKLIDSKPDVMALLRPPPLRDVQHRKAGCTSQRWWLHVWGEYCCGDCFPCRDEAALVTAGGN